VLLRTEAALIYHEKLVNVTADIAADPVEFILSHIPNTPLPAPMSVLLSIVRFVNVKVDLAVSKYPNP